MFLKKLINTQLASILGLFLISLLACIINYTPGTYLTGWDTLHPEFDFWLNFKRIIFGVWREEQGLGALSVHAHISELPRLILLWILSFGFPQDSLRYISVLLPLIAGPIGVYLFIRNIFLRGNNLTSEVSAFLGGLFYLLNLGTVQHFFVAFEMFTTLYGVLPWLFLFASKFIFENKKKWLVWFSLATMLSAPSAYAPTLWYVYFGSLVIYLSAFYKFNLKKKRLSNLALIILSTLLLNSYWLLPNIYQVVTSSGIVTEAKNNQMFSGKAFDHDAKYGILPDTFFLKSFLFDWKAFQDGQFQDLLKNWKEHLNKPWVEVIGWPLIGIMFYGLYTGLKKARKITLPIFLTFIVSFIFLLHGQWPLTYLFDILRDSSSLFREGLRFPWTKFSLIVMFAYSIFFAQGVFSLLKLVSNKVIKIALPILVAILLFVWCLPIFQGQLVSPILKTNIPQEYFDMYSWFGKNQDKGRIAVFPSPSYWGWDYYKWGFQGAGFIWFGLEQPVLVRDFDRWTPHNENYYWEISYAVDKRDLDLFEKTLEKYKVSWIIFDKNVFNPSFPSNLHSEGALTLITNSEKLSKSAQFGSIEIYKVDLPTNDDVYLLKDAPVVGAISKWGNNDRAYTSFGEYISEISPTKYQLENTYVYYPFRSLFTGKSQNDIQVEIEESKDDFIFKSKLPSRLKDIQTNQENIVDDELIWIDPNDHSKIGYFGKDLKIEGDSIEVKVPKVEGYYNVSSTVVEDGRIRSNFKTAQQYCNSEKDPKIQNQTVSSEGKVFLRVISKDAINCSISLVLPNLPHKLGFIVSLETKNKEGQPLLFWVEDSNLRKSTLESYLPKSKEWDKYYYILPPLSGDGLGYTLHLDNISIGRNTSINDIGKIEVYLLPFTFLSNLNLTQSFPYPTQVITDLEVSNSISDSKKVSLPDTKLDNHTLVLPQSFHKGWQAYYSNNQFFPFLGEKLKNHVLVNNWANGWLLEDNQNKKVVVIFWPQYLEYLGFIFALGWIIKLLPWRFKK